mgnify:CR=1 FL=1
MFVASFVVTAQEFEPNDSCDQAQLESAGTLPLVIDGSLDSSQSFDDVDFYRFTGNPGEMIQVDLEGESTGAGTLEDPLVGLFDTFCAWQNADDDGGAGRNSQLNVVVPDDGEFVIGVTYCCDYSFFGGGNGTYQLGLSLLHAVGPITGVLVDSETGMALAGGEPPWPYANLYRCNGTECTEYVSSAATNEFGEFEFPGSIYGEPLLNGTYEINAFAFGYQDFSTGPFDITTNGTYDLGSLALVPLPLVGLISGRLVDAVDGMPLAGSGPYFAQVSLVSCENEFCYSVAYGEPGDDGVFRLDGREQAILEGEYTVVGYANGHWETMSEPFTVSQNEDLDIGTLVLTPFPISIEHAQPCELMAGQVCRFGVEVRARTTKRLRGEAWGIVEYISHEGLVNTSRFQVGRNGHAAPQSLNLAAGETRMLTFELQIPDEIPDGAFMCFRVFVGRSPHPQFNVLAEQFLFCANNTQGSLSMLDSKAARQKLKALSKRPPHPHGR